MWYNGIASGGYYTIDWRVCTLMVLDNEALSILAVFRTLNPDYQKSLLALAEALLQLQTECDDSSETIL